MIMMFISWSLFKNIGEEVFEVIDGFSNDWVVVEGTVYDSVGINVLVAGYVSMLLLNIFDRFSGSYAMILIECIPGDNSISIDPLAWTS